MKREFKYGEKVRRLREERAWTQEQLAMAAGLDTRTIQRVEADRTRNFETLQAIAGAFEVSLDSLRTAWRVPESRLIRTSLVSTYRAFVCSEERHRHHAYTRGILAPLKPEFQSQIDDLISQVFADRDLIEPDEPELWRSYVECIKDPLQELFDLGFEFFLIDEERDLLLQAGSVGSETDHIDDWRIRHYMLVGRNGCFRLDKGEELHRFNENCAAAGNVLFDVVHDKVPRVQVLGNALYALEATLGEHSVNWCNACFPEDQDGNRITAQYLSRITGLNPAQLHELYERVCGEVFLQGLS